jgi:hypothetical protein
MANKDSKYDPLKRWLQNQQRQLIDMTFDEIANLVGGLPISATKRAAWWANESTNVTHSQCRAWLEAGYSAQADRVARKVRFKKIV